MNDGSAPFASESSTKSMLWKSAQLLAATANDALLSRFTVRESGKIEES